VTRILVTGGSGFLGRHCLAALADAGELHAVSRHPGSEGATGVVRHAADLLDDGAIRSVIAKIRPTHLLHAAWEATPVSYASSLENLRWLKAGVTLLHAFGEAGGNRFLGVGTSAEYAPSGTPCVEDETHIRPSTVYGHAKAAMHQAVQGAARHHGFSAAWARVFLPYGPGDPPQRLVPSLIAAFRAGQRLPMSDGGQIRDFVYAPDAGAMLAALLLSDAAGAFNIGSGAAMPLRQAVEAIAASVGGEGLAEFGALPRRPGEPQMLAADMTRTFAVPGMPRPGAFARRLREML
jgi:nucleoside-diphosphate-sugar epimerase